MTARPNPRLPLPAKPRILVVSLRRIGDALLTTPLIRSLRRAWPEATIDVLTFAGPARIIDGNPDVDHVIGAPERPTTAETLSLVAGLFKRYHLAISTQPGDRPIFFAVLAGRAHAGLTDTDGPRLGHIVKAHVLDRSTPAVPDIQRVEHCACVRTGWTLTGRQRRHSVGSLCGDPCRAHVPLQAMDARGLARARRGTGTARPEHRRHQRARRCGAPRS